MKKKFIILLFIILFSFVPISKVHAIELKYQAHVQTYGWLKTVNENEIAGTTGQFKRMEGLKIYLDNDEYEGSITYQAHVQTYGWLKWVNNNELAGTTGQFKRMEAIKIKLTDELSEHYSVYYRAHVQTYGWLKWVKDGEIAGTTGQFKRMEAIQIKLVPKDNRDLTASYTVHNSDGWGNYVNNGEIAGTTGQFKRIDYLKIKLNNNTSYNGNINYQTYITSKGWSTTSTDDKESGFKDKTLEAIKINLTDELKENFDIYYRVHVSKIGWMDWTSNGKPAGTKGYFHKIEAVQIKILPKDDNSITISDKAYKEYDNKVLYSTYIQGGIWQDYISEGTGGTEGQSKRAEAFKIKLDSVLSGNVIYKTYIAKRGWSEESKNGEMSGTMNLSRNIEGISIKLDGDISECYDIYYRTHVQTTGWLSWTKNGEYAGTINNNRRVEGIEIKLVEKGSDVSLDTKKPLLTGSWKNNNTNYYDYYGSKVTDFRLIDGVKYYFNEEGTLIGKKVKKVIDVSSWQEKIDWNKIKKQEDVDAAILRVGWGAITTDDVGVDSWFDYNIKEVQRLKIPYSIYIYGYAKINSAADKESKFVIDMMKKYNIPKDTFVWYDAEINSYSVSIYNSVIPRFINNMKSSGYTNVGVYGSVNNFVSSNGNLNSNTIKSYPLWIAQYYKKIQYSGKYNGWQFTSDGTVDGVNTRVDVSMFY